MALAKVNRPTTLPVAEKERKGSLDNLFAQKTEKDPFLSLSKTSENSFQWLHLLHALDQGKQDNGTEKKEAQPIDSHEKYLPGWPLVPSTLSKMEMQKCERCSKEFCSTINYRRHIRTHRRSPNIEMDFQKNRDQVGEFWDKLSLEEVKNIVSLDDVDIEGTSGSTILKYLSLWNNKPNISSLPSVYIKAGGLLSEIVQGKPGCLPLTSNVFFCILDDASENTFMCAGNVTLVQKFLFDGDAEKIITEMKNLAACLSYLLELKLVRAWLADKAAEALRCQKMLVEEEEAAQKRRSELLEKKRLKKLRQKRDKQKDASEPGSKASPEMIEDAIASPGVQSPTAQSESGSPIVEEPTTKDASEPGSKAPPEMIEDAIVSPGARSPTAQSESASSSVEEATTKVASEPGSKAPPEIKEGAVVSPKVRSPTAKSESGSFSVEEATTKNASEPDSKAPPEVIEDAVVSPRVRSPTAKSESGSSSVEEATTHSVRVKPEMNHDEVEDPDLVVDGVNVEDTKSVVDAEIKQEHPSDSNCIVDPEIKQENPSDTTRLAEPEKKQEHPCDKVDIKNERGPISSESLEVLIGSISVSVEDSSLVGSGLTHLRSVDRKENRLSKDTRRGLAEREKNSIQSESVGSYEKGDDMLDMEEPSVEWRNMVPGPRLFSPKEAAALLALRWREAIASDHVTLDSSPERAARDMVDPGDTVSSATKPKPKSRK
ncbi:hypothetical protein LUZ62_062489 [Rhynchospora pubera]|uniref:C2H2-type domain-containing protein n=1 Tax=Rhynchospora pubera TaxID=906938 RepID=A0AAV8EJ64_9POAL|nr:hypothetical protein LUZ62_062489 [Rhynchospora pubera]